jgi:hypothetical protein
VRAATPAYGGRSRFVPSAPVWELVRRRQALWGLDDDAMCDVLDWHPQWVDARPDAPMLRSNADNLHLKPAAPGEPQPTLFGSTGALVEAPAAKAQPAGRRAIDAGKATDRYAVA